MSDIKKNHADAPGGMQEAVHAIMPEDVPEAPAGASATGKPRKPRKAHPVRRGVLITVLAFAAYFTVTGTISLAIDPYVGAWNEVVMQLAFRLPLGLAACRLLLKGKNAPAIRVRKMHRGHFLAFAAALLFLIQVPTQLACYYMAGASGAQAAVPFADMAPVAGLLNQFILAPVIEEIIFRGVFFMLSRRYMGFWPATLANMALFTLMHDPANMLTAAMHTPMYCMMYEATGHARYGAALHFAFNTVSLVPAMLLLPFVPVPLALAMGAAAAAASVVLYVKRSRLMAWLVPQNG